MKTSKLEFLIIFACIVCLFSIFFVPSGFAATYYLKNGGNDNLDGQSWDNAWATIRKVNRINPPDGSHIVNLRPGDTFDDATLTLESWRGTYAAVTIQSIDGDGRTIARDGKAKLDGDSNPPIYINNDISGNIQNLTLKDLNCDGTASNAAPVGKHIYLYKIAGVTIDGIDANGHSGRTVNGKNGIYLIDCTGTIEIKNSTLQNWGPSNLPTMGTEDYNGISVFYTNHNVNNSTDTISIHHNTIHRVDADSVYVAGFTGKSANIYNNDLYAFGEQALDYKASSNLVFHHNDCYDGIGDGGTGGSSVLVIHKPDKTFWPDPSHNIIIRDNYLRDDDDEGITISGINNARNMMDVSVYRNRFENIEKENIRIAYASRIDVYNNFFLSLTNNMSCESAYCSIIYLFYYSQNNISIYNNTIYVGSEDTNRNYGIAVNNGKGQILDNVSITENIIQMDRNSSVVYPLYVTGNPENMTVDYNTYYGAHSNRVYWNGKSYDSAAFGGDTGDWNESRLEHSNDTSLESLDRTAIDIWPWDPESVGNTNKDTGQQLAAPVGLRISSY